MHRWQRLQFSIAILMFAVASFAQKEHVPNRLGLSVEADQRRQALSFSVSTLLTRNLHDVFGENDPKRRRAAIDEIFTEDCVFYEPSGRVYRGRDEIDRVAGTLRARHPDFRYQPIAEPELVEILTTGAMGFPVGARRRGDREIPTISLSLLRFSV